GFRADLEPTQTGVTVLDHAGRTLVASATPAASLEARDGRVRLVREDPAEALRVEETWAARETHIEVAATITHTGPAPASRAIEACVSLPVDLVGRTWHHDIQRAERIEPGNVYR